MCNQLDVIYWLLENATLNASDIWSLKSINKYIAKKVVQISVSTGKKKYSIAFIFQEMQIESRTQLDFVAEICLLILGSQLC